jgi:hypothetical protein
MSITEKLAIALPFCSYFLGCPRSHSAIDTCKRRRKTSSRSSAGTAPGTYDDPRHSRRYRSCSSQERRRGTAFLEGYDVTVDAIYPGKFTYADFVADKAGTFGFTCTRVCGEGHHQMWGELVVEPRTQP